MHRQSSKVDLTCPQCERTFKRYPSQALPGATCSRECKRLSMLGTGAPPIICVYTITHIPSGLVYVGSTNNVKARWKHHRQTLRKGTHKNARLQKAWASDGADAFAFAILEAVIDVTELRSTEQLWLDRLRPFDPARGFNIDLNSRGRTGRPRTREAVELTAIAHRGSKRPPETRARISAAKRGTIAHNRRFTDEQIAAIRARLASGVSDCQVGREYAAAPQVIRRIRIGESYPIRA